MTTITRRLACASSTSLVALAIAGCEGPTPGQVDQTQPRADAARDTFDQPRKPMPPNGAIGGRFDYAALDRSELCSDQPGGSDPGATGTLKVSVPNGRQTYVAKLVTKRGKHTWAPMVIRPGRSVTVSTVPVCGGHTTYDLYFGAGTKWYGPTYLFGPKGAYSQGDDALVFKPGSSWEISLTARIGGNLSSSDLDYGDFIE